MDWTFIVYNLIGWSTVILLIGQMEYKEWKLKKRIQEKDIFDDSKWE